MRIVQILPGSGDRFYCENCVRDNALSRSLKAAGQDVVMAPVYLPPSADGLEGPPRGPVFYGGINAWLQQSSGFFRKTPRWMDAIFDTGPFLRMAARRAGSVRASNLGEMTLSVLEGEEGKQAKELERLIRWLERMERPDVVHLSSSLLLGIGAAVKKRLGLPVVCSLQDEDSWVDAMEEPARSGCWEAMAERAVHVDAFVAVSGYFAAVMSERLRIKGRMCVVPVGVDPARFAPSAHPADPPAVGFLARLCESLGLGILAEAVLKLKGTERFKNLRLHLTGGMTDDDAPYLAKLREKCADVKIFEEFDTAHRAEFLRSITVLSVPAPKPVAFGTYVLEALAAGVPAALPRHGSFVELVGATGGGVLYEPNDATTLAGVLGDLLSDGKRRAELAGRGRESVVRDFSEERMAARMMDVYRGVKK